MTGEHTLAGTSLNTRDLAVHRFKNLIRPEIVHGSTSRTPDLPLHGNMSFMVGDAPDLVLQNREAWASAIGYDASRLVLGRQVHETTIAVVDERHAGSGADSVETSLRRVDALVTQAAGLPIGVMAADCVPILMYDPSTRAIAAVHAGWRGTVDGIAAKAIDVMSVHFGSKPRDLRVGLGPSICQDCYQVGPEVIERWLASRFAAHSEVVRKDSSGLYFELRDANRFQLTESGVHQENIETSPICTRCADGAMFSRRGLGPRTGLFASVIMLAGEGDRPQRSAR